jgi:hypothetical protein
MKYFNHHKRQHSAERRLCYSHIGSGPESLGGAKESVDAHEKMANNPHLKGAMDLYDNAIVRTEFPELTSHSPDRPYLVTLLMDGMIEDGVSADYENLDKSNIDAFDPFKFTEKYPGPEKMGVFLKSFLDEDTLSEIHANGAAASDTALGGEYLAIIGQQRLLTSRNNELDNKIFVQVNLKWYRHVQEKLDSSLTRYGVRSPGMEMEFVEDRATNPKMRMSLTREEYLTLVKNGVEDEANTSFADREKLLDAARAPVNPLDNRTKKVFTDLSVDKFGPTETLKRFGVEVGEATRRRYVDARMGVVRGTDGIEAPEGHPAKPEMIPSAAEWRRSPEVAYQFLSENMPSSRGSSNKVFLDSLHWHFVFTEADRETGIQPDPLMSEEDARAVLYLTSQSFLEYENLMTESSRQRVSLKEEMTFENKAEGFASNAWEYMKDIQSHPIGSGLMWVSAIVIARNLFKGVFKGKMPMWKFLPIAGVALGMYQQSTKGRAWWNTFTDKYDKMMEDENLKNPEERTLPNYWLRELSDIKGNPGQFDELTPEKERLSFSLIGQVGVDKTLSWYDEWRVWRNNPSGTPPNIPVDYYDHMNSLGTNVTDEQVGEYMFMSLQKFFIHRGQDVKRQQLPFDIPAGMSDDEGLGFAYIKEKYLEHRMYGRLIEEMGVSRDLILSDMQIEILKDDKPMTDDEIKAKFPKMFELIIKFRAMEDSARKKNVNQFLYLMELNRTEKFEVPSANYPFNHVLFMEGNPEAMARIDGQNAGTASPWAKVMALFSPSNSAPPVSAPIAATPSPTGGPSTTPTSGGSTSPTGGPASTPASGGSTTPAAGPSTTPASGGSTTPAAAPTASPASGGSTTPAAAPTASPASGGSTPATGGPSTTPAAAPSTPSTGGGSVPGASAGPSATPSGDGTPGSSSGSSASDIGGKS